MGSNGWSGDDFVISTPLLKKMKIHLNNFIRLQAGWYLVDWNIYDLLPRVDWWIAQINGRISFLKGSWRSNEGILLNLLYF